MRLGARLATLSIGCLVADGCALIAGITDVVRVDGGGGASSSSTGGASSSSTGGASSSSTGGGACPGHGGVAGCDGGTCQLLAQPGSLPQGIALLEGSIYVSLTGSNAVIGRGPTGLSFSVAKATHSPQEVAADQDGVFWGNYSESCLKRAPLDGGATTRLGSCITGMNLAASKIALDATRAYWIAGADLPTGDVVAIDKNASPDAGITVVAAAQQRALAVAVDEDFVYWGTATQSPPVAGSILRRGRALTAKAEHFADAPGLPTAIVVRDGYVYWIAMKGDAVYRKLATGGSAAVEQIAPGPSYYYSTLSLAVDDAHVYWTDPGGGRVLRAAKVPGAAADTLAHDPIDAPGDVAVDCAAVYWTTPTTGTVTRLSK